VNNPTLEAAYNARSMPTKTYTDVPSAVDGTTLNAMFIYPPGFNAKAATKYPVLMHVYGGPNSQQVSKRMESPSHLGFHMFLAASMNVIVVIADNRGTCCRGDAFLKSTYLELGIIETQDQLAVADYLASLSYVDAAHIGLWGWSYGGFMASRVITAASKSIAMTMAVAPVTKWDYYDSAYTERFMQTPATNAAGYNVTSVLPRASAILPSARFLLIHGTADDNVHLQHSTVFSTQLVTNGVSYDTMYYTDKNHGTHAPRISPWLSLSLSGSRSLGIDQSIVWYSYLGNRYAQAPVQEDGRLCGIGVRPAEPQHQHSTGCLSKRTQARAVT